MSDVAPTRGGALLSLFTGLAEAFATGLAATKPVESGCDTCPEDAQPTAQKKPRRRTTHGRYRRRSR